MPVHAIVTLCINHKFYTQFGVFGYPNTTHQIQHDQTLVSCPDYFSHAEGKMVWSTAYSIFVPSTTMVVLQSDCLMRMTSSTAVNGDQRKLGSWSAMRLSQVEPENDRQRNVRRLRWTGGVCFRAWKLAVWSSWASNVDEIVSELSEVDRNFMFCECSFLGVQKLREGWFLQQAVSLEPFRSFKFCVTTHNTFLKTLHHQFLNRTEKLNRQLTRLFFSLHVRKIL